MLQRLQTLEPDTYFRTTLTNRWGQKNRDLEIAYEEGTQPVLVKLSDFGSAIRHSSPSSVLVWDLRAVHGDCLVEPL